MADRAQVVEVVGARKDAAGGGDDEVVLGVEDPEDRALSNAGCRGEFLCRHVESALEHERDGGVDERSPTVVRRQGWRPDWLGQGGHHRVTLSE